MLLKLCLFLYFDISGIKCVTKEVFHLYDPLKIKLSCM